MILKLLTAIAITLSAPATAQSLARDGSLNLCTLMAGFAEIIMVKRQERIPLTKALDVALQFSSGLGLPWSPLKNLTLQAYERPVASSEQARQQAIGDFADGAMLECMKEVSSVSE